jgi:hypothetical protein
MTKFYIQEGADVHNPPRKVLPLPQDTKIVETYRYAPYLIQSACT